MILYYITRNLAIHGNSCSFSSLMIRCFLLLQCLLWASLVKDQLLEMNHFLQLKFPNFLLSAAIRMFVHLQIKDLRFSITFCKWSSILENQTGSFQGGRFTACVRVISDTTASKTSITPHQLIKISWPRTWNINTCIANITIMFYTSFTLHAHINRIT